MEIELSCVNLYEFVCLTQLCTICNVFTIFEDNPKNEEDPEVQDCTKKEDNPKMRTTPKISVSVPPGSQCITKNYETFYRSVRVPFSNKFKQF